MILIRRSVGQQPKKMNSGVPTTSETAISA